jgi:Glycosyl hydrolases family 6
MGWLPGASRKVVAMVAAGVLMLVALGFLLLRAQAPGPGSDEQAYQQWVNGFAAGLGDRPAVVILEPDALAQLASCLDHAQQQARLRMLSYAVKTLQTKSDQVYLDAGHSNWVPAGQMAARLRAADVAQAYGFALNVSNYDATGQETGYAAELDRELGMAKRFVVDTSRNGEGSAGGRLPAGGSISRARPGAGGGALASQLFTDPDTQAADWVRAHPGDPRAREIEKHIANQPTATWFGAWSGDIAAAVSSYTIAASIEHKVPVLVAYNIPHLDCGGSVAGPKPWCNAPGRQLGPVPQVLDDRGDLGLWIKAPGESDGDCGAGAGTRAGEFSPALATELITGRS